MTLFPYTTLFRSGVTRNFTDMANGQKVDYAMRYGNTDTAQEVEARGTNFAFKTNADAMMMNGRFDNVALNKAISSGANSGNSKDSGNVQSVNKGGSVNDSGQINNSDSHKVSESNKIGHGDKQDYSNTFGKTDSKNMEKGKDITDNTTISNAKANSSASSFGVSGKISTPGQKGVELPANVGANVEQKWTATETTKIDNSLNTRNTNGHTDGTKFDKNQKTSDGEYKGNDHDNTETRDNTNQATTTKGYQDRKSVV